jgi:hypothetical protein
LPHDLDPKSLAAFRDHAFALTHDLYPKSLQLFGIMLWENSRCGRRIEMELRDAFQQQHAAGRF